MADTRERILTTALTLFAREGYEAVSVSDIAGALGMTKGALYRHYASKRDIFDSILRRMERQDAEQAERYQMDGVPGPEQIAAFSLAMFRYWTQDAFAAPFRRLLTLEQYRSDEMARLYQQYLAGGPMDYVAELFAQLGIPEPRRQAAAYYGPMFLLYSLADAAEDKDAVWTLAEDCLKKERIPCP